jgi:anhydro-N-acetylmuramic acid kinase
MSGTSADGADAAVVELTREAGRLQVSTRSALTLAFDPPVRDEILAACVPSSGTVDRICRLNAVLGEWFARAALAAVERANVPLRQVALIASHGQTIWHAAQPGAETPATLQIGEPAVIAERTGCTVVANFRPRDVAAGGQGAPLMSYVDYLLFGDAVRSRALQNIGGIANVSWLPADGGPQAVVAFDTGPGNVVIDGLMSTFYDLPCDLDGRVAAGGNVDAGLLAELLADPFFLLPPPKTTGREQFGADYAARLVTRGRARGTLPADLVATATALTARSIAEAYDRFLPIVDEVVISGGGARNPVLVAWLADEFHRRQRFPVFRRPEDFGISTDAKEAIGFAILGFETIHGRVGNLPNATGARHPVILGTIVPGDNYRRLLGKILAP